MDTIFTMLFIEVKNDFAIAPRPEAMPPSLKFRSEFDEVVYFTVGDQRQRLVFVVQGLPAVGEVDNAESSHRQSHMRPLIQAGPVRATVYQCSVHSQELFMMERTQRRGGDDAGNTAHDEPPFPVYRRPSVYYPPSKPMVRNAQICVNKLLMSREIGDS